MKLLKLLFRDNRLPLSGIVLLSLCSAMLSVGVIAFINLKLIRLEGELATTLLSFLGLLALLMISSGAGQVALHTLGHRFVYRLRRSLVRRVLDTDIERLEQIGGARILASLSSDIRNITIAFVYLPELTYGLILSIAAFTYLAWLSPALFGITAGWLGLTLLVGWFFVGKVNQHIRLLREAEDHLYQDYQAIIDGRKELALNRDRARLLNGSSKSTLARLLTGLHRPAAGEIKLDGRVLQPHEWQAYRQRLHRLLPVRPPARPGRCRSRGVAGGAMAGAPASTSQGALRQRATG